MKRKMMSMILSGACLLSLIGCGNSSADSAQASGASSAPKEASSAPQEAEGSTGAVSDAEEKTSEDVKVVIGATGLQEDQFTQVMINGYKDAAAELGIDIITSNSQHSAETETEQINNMLEAGAQVSSSSASTRIPPRRSRKRPRRPARQCSPVRSH